MRRLALAAVILGAVALPTKGQSPRTPTAPLQTTSISGRVVDNGTGSALPNVRITVTAVPLGAPVVLTDADGRFSLLAPDGARGIVASKSGYARTEVTLATAGQPIEIRLQRGAAISGRVMDDLGEPVIGARVTAELRSDSPPNPRTIATTETDDRGEYRLAPLPSGMFTVAVTTVATAWIRGETRHASDRGPSQHSEDVLPRGQPG